jgi:hypothetical protein
MALLLLFLLYEIAARLAAGTSVTTGKVVPATYEKRYLVSPNILVTSGDSDDMPINRRFCATSIAIRDWCQGPCY